MTTHVVQVSKPSAQRSVDVVFIHGLNGDPIQTWSNSRTSEPWTEWLAADVPSAGVWSIGYEAWASRWQGPAMPLQDRGVNVLALLQAEGLGDNPLVLIAHSMGGLVVKQLLFQAKVLSPEYGTIADAIAGVAYLATPHTGSGLANVADFFRRIMRGTVAIQDLQDGAPYLRMLTKWYRDNASQLDLRHLVMYENQTTAGVLVVDEVSADPGIVGVTPIRIDADHASICKPRSRTDLVYRQCLRLVSGVAANGSAQGTAQRSLPELTVQPLRPLMSPPAELRSAEFNDPTYIEFYNATGALVEVFWHDYDGNEVLCAALISGEVKRFQTYVSHLWSAVSVERGRLGYFYPVKEVIGRIELT